MSFLRPDDGGGGEGLDRQLSVSFLPSCLVLCGVSQLAISKEVTPPPPPGIHGLYIYTHVSMLGL